jgi:hypothetical protein
LVRQAQSHGGIVFAAANIFNKFEATFEPPAGSLGLVAQTTKGGPPWPAIDA